MHATMQQRVCAKLMELSQVNDKFYAPIELKTMIAIVGEKTKWTREKILDICTKFVTDKRRFEAKIVDKDKHFRYTGPYNSSGVNLVKELLHDQQHSQEKRHVKSSSVMVNKCYHLVQYKQSMTTQEIIEELDITEETLNLILQEIEKYSDIKLTTVTTVTAI